MTKKEIKAKLQAQYDEMAKSMFAYSDMMDDDLKEIGKTFDEAMKDKSISLLLTYKIWCEKLASLRTIEETAKSFGVILKRY